MNYENYQDLAVAAHERDPRASGYGYFSGGSFVLDDVRMFSWFKSLPDLAAHIREVEPRVYDMEAGDELSKWQATLDPILDQILSDGLSEPARKSLNDATKDAYVIHWCGTFDSLKAGDSDFGKSLRADFRGEEDDISPILDDESDDFVDFLQSYGY